MSADEITELSAAVAAMGALPMPVLVGPEPLSVERLAVLRKLRTHCEADRFESEDERPLHVWGPSQYPKREMCQRCTVTREWAEDADADEVVLVAEVDRLRAQVADLLAERHVTNEALDDAVQALRAVRFFLADVDGGDPTLWLSEAAAREHCEAVLGTEVSGRSFDWVPDGDVCQLVFVDGLTDRVRAAGSAWVWPLAVQGPVSTAGEDGCTCPETDRVEPHWSGCPLEDAPCPVDGPIPGVGVGAGAPEMRALRAALYGPPDGEHYAAVHHTYLLGHDLPETGGAS